MIISMVSTKGGQGKSTLSLCMSYSKAFEKKYKNVGLVEMDIQGTLRSWYVERSEKKKNENDKVSFTHLIETKPQVVKNTITDTIKRNDVMIMDIAGEGVGREYIQFALLQSDVVIIPMRSSVNDEASFYDNLNPEIQRVIKKHPERKGVFHILPTFVHPSKNPQKVREYFQEILPDYVKILPCCFFFRGVYDDYNFGGNTLREYLDLSKTNQREHQKAKKANEDIENISKHIIKMDK